MRVYVRFEGGSWGGEERQYDRPPPKIAMPARIVSQGISYISETGTIPAPRMVVDEYVYHRRDVARDALVYRWVRPNIEGMQDEIARLRARVHELENPPRRGLVRFAR